MNLNFKKKKNIKQNKKIPKHLAIIMDGNGRWASHNNKERIDGHRRGVRAVKEITEYCVKVGIEYLTLYTFSNENWKRPKSEVLALMKLLLKSLDEQLELLLRNNIKLTVIGDMDKLDLITRCKLKDVIYKTSKNRGMNLNLAISYGGRQEIISAINKFLKLNKNKFIDEDQFRSFLYTSNIPDPDLLIRTGGEYRISNFLLWQIAYTEIYFSKKFWPEFTENEIKLAIADFQNRDRRYGKIIKN